MGKTAEQILKLQGSTDDDIAAMSTMLSNPRVRASIENGYNGLEQERDQFRTRSEEFEGNYNQAVNVVTAREKEAMDARMEAARANELLKIAKDFGYVDQEEERRRTEELSRNPQPHNPGNQAPAGFNPEDPKFREFANRFSMGEGDAMALYNFVSEEYRLLNGGSLNDYVGKDGKRGMIALRAEALANRKPVDVYANEKFNWDGKRAEQVAARQKAHDDEVARKAVEDWSLKHGANPMTAIANPSRMPLMPTKINDGKPVQPWDRPMATAERRQRAFENETRARVQ